MGKTAWTVSIVKITLPNQRYTVYTIHANYSNRDMVSLFGAFLNLKKKYGFISAYTEHYPETDKPSTEAPGSPVSSPRPVFYNSHVPSLNEILLEAETQSVTQPQVIEGSNSLYFDRTDQPPSQPYLNNPNILVARRNISSSTDVLEYLNELMKESSSAEERETTMRSFFKPDLLSVASKFPEEFPLLKEIDKVQESLGNNKNFWFKL